MRNLPGVSGALGTVISCLCELLLAGVLGNNLLMLLLILLVQHSLGWVHRHHIKVKLLMRIVHHHNLLLLLLRLFELHSSLLLKRESHTGGLYLNISCSTLRHHEGRLVLLCSLF